MKKTKIQPQKFVLSKDYKKGDNTIVINNFEYEVVEKDKSNIFAIIEPNTKFEEKVWIK